MKKTLFDFEYWEQSALKQNGLEPNLHPEGPVLPPSPSLFCDTVRIFLPSAWKFTCIFQFSFMFVWFQHVWRVLLNKQSIYVKVGGSELAEDKVLAPFRKCCPVVLWPPPLSLPEMAWTMPGKCSDTQARSYSDCYCCWLMAPSQPCLLSAGLSSKMDIAISFPSFFGGQSLTLLYLSDVASWWVFITPNCFCAAGISSSPAPTLTHRYTAKTLKKILYCWPFVAGSYSFPPAVCAAPETQHTLSDSVVSRL